MTVKNEAMNIHEKRDNRTEGFLNGLMDISEIDDVIFWQRASETHLRKDILGYTKISILFFFSFVSATSKKMCVCLCINHRK